jgi:F0F1-type ATP synthase assembly protein I
MRKRGLAIILATAMGLVVTLDACLILILAWAHRPFYFLLGSMAAVTPGFVIAALAWRGRLPSRCAARR